MNVSFQWIEHFDYPDPGIRATRVLTTTASYWQVTAPVLPAVCAILGG